jgi:hypothetical protein
MEGFHQMSIAAITATRGDRPQFLEHCKYQVSMMQGIDEHIIIDHPPVNAQPDLTQRVKEGVQIAKEKGHEWAVIIEDDDFYPADHVLRMWPHFDRADFIGCEFTFYINLRNRTWERTSHPNHSSLFCTAFRISAMDNFKWHLAHKVFLDRDLWNYAKKFRRSFIEMNAIGIKGGHSKETLVGGKGHKGTFPNKDPELRWLKSKVDQESFEFYSKLELK